MHQPMKKMSISLGLLATLSAVQAQGGVSASASTTYNLSTISEIKYGSISNAETLEIKGTGFMSGPSTIVLQNKSSSATAARILAACYKNAQFAAANGGTIAFTHKNLTSAADAGITGKLISGTYTATFTENYPVAGETKTFICEASSSSPSSL